MRPSILDLIPRLVTLAAVCLGALAGLPVLAQGDPPVFVDGTQSAGIVFEHHDAAPLPGMLPGEQTRFGSGPAVSDYDRDGDLDLYLVDSQGYSNRLLRNDGAGGFEDVTATAGVANPLGMGHMALFVDLDDDGFEDLVVLNDSSGWIPGELTAPFSRIYRNRRDGSFEDVSNASGFDPRCRIVGGATAGDYDRDGDLDLYVTGWFDYHNYLYRNDGGFRFVDVTDAAGLRNNLTFVAHWAPLFVDLDGDRWPDLFCAVDFFEDYIFFNQGDGTFLPGNSFTHIGNDMGVAAADFDRDGDIDLYTTNVTGDNDPAECCNWLYINDGNGGVTNQAPTHGVQDSRWGWGTVFLDADLDGHLDLFAVNGWQQPEWVTPATFFHNDGTQQFTERASESGLAHVGNSRSTVAFDADRDGDLDVLIADAYGPVTFYRNDTRRGDRHYLSVRLRGTESNASGVGARVTVTAGGESWMQELVSGGSFYASPPLELHFGLGSRTQVEEVVVQWPSGRVDTRTGVGVDRVLFMGESKAARDRLSD